MKKLTIGVLMLMVFIAGACKKSNDDAAATGGSATVTANNHGFDGSASLGKFTSTKAGITQVTAGGITTFSISAIKDGGNTSITVILLKKVTAVGKIQFGPSLGNGGIILSKDYTKPGDAALNYSTDLSGPNMQGGGEINITKLDGDQVEGTFVAQLYNNARSEAFVEQGTFKGTIK